MAKALSLFYPLITPHALGCPSPLMDTAILKAASDFCRFTLAIQTITTQSVAAGQPDYDLETPTGTQLVSILGVFYKDIQLGPVALDDVHSGFALRGATVGEQVVQGEPRQFFQKDPLVAAINVYPVPAVAAADALAIRAAFEPTATATTLPDALYDRYSDGIAAGALEYLTALPSQPFTNPKTAEVQGAIFRANLNAAKLQASGLLRKSTRVRPRQFA